MPPFRLQLDQVGRDHHRRERILEVLRIFDIAMQRASDVPTIEHTLFFSEDIEERGRPFSDQRCVARRCHLVDAPARDRATPALDLARANALVRGRLDLKTAFRVAAMIDPHVVAGPRQVQVRKLLPCDPHGLELLLR